MINKKIDFLICGVQKAGTSSLNNYLRQHPEIGMARANEVHFFDNEEVFSKPKINFNLLEKQFDFRKDIKVFGETTPIYLFWEPCMKRIWEYNKNIKLIASLRNPIHRAFSQWNMEINRNNENEDFLYCIKNEIERSKASLPLQHRFFSYTARGFYSEQIRRMLRFFPQSQLIFLKYEDYLSNQFEALLKILEFLNVDAGKFDFRFSEIHKTYYKRQMTSEEKDYLKYLYHNDINEVERLLNWNCEDWKS